MGWQWHQLDHMQIICTSLKTDNQASTSPLSFLQAGCPSWCQTNSVKSYIYFKCRCQQYQIPRLKITEYYVNLFIGFATQYSTYTIYMR